MAVNPLLQVRHQQGIRVINAAVRISTVINGDSQPGETIPWGEFFILHMSEKNESMSEIKRLYILEGKTLKETREIMMQRGFEARWADNTDNHHVQVYKSHFKKWNFMKNRRPVRKHCSGALAVSIPCHGMLLALTVLSADWWGFLNVLAMILSVVVRVMLAHQNRAGINKAIDANRSATGGTPAKLLLIMDDSKVVTMEIPCHLVKAVFIKAPTVPNNHLYRFTRWVGWAAFAAHIVSIGIASLPTQICTVFLIVASTILTTFKVGCDDWRMEAHITQDMGNKGEQAPEGVSCRISSSLTAICSEYPKRYDEWVQRFGQLDSEDPSGRPLHLLTDDELDSMKMWNLVPQTKNTDWWTTFNAMRER